MSQDTTAGDNTPKLPRTSAIDTATALNLWYKFVEVANDFVTPLQFNKSILILGGVAAKNTAQDATGLKILRTTGVMAGQIWGDETNSVFKVESGSYPMFINSAPANSYISNRIADVEQSRLTTTGLGVGMLPIERLSLGTSVAGNSTSLGIYSRTTGNDSVYTTFTSDAAANLVVSYGRGTGGTGRNIVLTGNGGTSAYFDVNANLGINNAGPVYAGYAGSRYVTVKGVSNCGVVELSSGGADAGGIITGSIYATDVNSTSGDKRLAALEFGTDGTTANNRGGFARLLVKTNGASGLNEIWRVHQSGQMSIGVNAPFSDEVLRLYKSTGSKLLLSDVNNVITLASVPVSSASEFSVGVNGGEALRVDQARRLGIQTSTPLAKLDIGGAAANTAQAVMARGGDINFQLTARNGSSVNASGEVVFTFGSEYYNNGATLTGGLQFVRGGNAQNMVVNMYADSVKVMQFGETLTTNYNRFLNAASTGRLSTQTNVTSAGLILQPAASGVDGTDGAFITFRNKAGTKAFSVGMDLDGEFRIGGGNIGTTAYKIFHEGYAPGAMISRGSVNWADADLYRETGVYQLRNSGNTASYGLIEFANIPGSTCRIQLIGWYGGGPNGSGNWNDNPDELYFRTARDTPTNWDGMPSLNNRIWHSSNLVDPITRKTDYTTPNGTYLRANNVPTQVGETYWSTPAYGIGQGDNRTHFGYLVDAVNGTCKNYIRGEATVHEGRMVLGNYDSIPTRGAKFLASYNGGGSQWGLTLNSLTDASSTVCTAVSFCYGGTSVSAGTTMGSITINGTTTSYNTTSDLRLKSNVRPAGPASEIVEAIEVVEYDFTDSKQHVPFGLGAQQLEPLAPQAVTKGNDTVIEKPEDIWQVDHSKLVPLLLKSQQELLNTVRNMKEDLIVARELIESLQGQITALKKNA